jgi:hypothetical protein
MAFWWIVFGVIFAAVLVVQFRPGGRWREMVKGRDHCAYCRAWLKWSDGSYAAECPKCGRAQPH